MAILSVELLAFTFSVWALMTLKKKKFPELFFPPAGVVVFRPPEAEDIQNVRDADKQKAKNLSKNRKHFSQPKKPTLPVRIQHATSKAFENIKYMADLELAVLMTYAITIATFVSFIFQFTNILPSTYNTPALSFYLNLSFLAVFIYNLVRIATFGGLAIYENKLSVIISILAGILLFILLFVGKKLISINFHRAFSLQLFHIRSVLDSADKDFGFFKIDSATIVFILLFCLFIYGLVPVIIKYGNSYIGMNKEAYKLEAQLQKEENERAMAAAGLNADIQGDPKTEQTDESQSSETLSQLKETKRTLRWFNLGLVFHLLEIFCWIKPITDTWNEYLNDGGVGLELLRVSFVLIHIITLLFTFKSEIGRYMLRVYDSIASLLGDASDDNLRAVRRRADAHIGYMGVMSYQVMMKIIIPFLLILLFVDKRISLFTQSQNNIQAYSNVNDSSFLDWNCYAITDPLEIVQQAHMCPTNKNLQISSVENGMGILSPLSQYQDEGAEFAAGKDILKKLQKYGLIHDEFWCMFFSLWLFLYYLVTYILSIVYIFYRKAVEQL